MVNMLFSLFHIILNMSLTSCVVILAVFLLRLPLKRAPKIYSYLLWFLVLFRLLCPVTLESTLSVFRLFEKDDVKISVMEPVPYDIGYQAVPEVGSYLPPVTEAVNQSLPAATPYKSLNPMQEILYLAAFVWIAAGVLLFARTLFSYFRLKKRLSTACLIQDNIYQSEEVQSPFVFGLLAPKIYLPVNLSKEETEYIVLHEKTHIKRFDYIFKLLWHIALCLHWFNPLVWLSFRLMEKDMEMSCDEAVLRILGEGIKADYSYSLLSLSLKKENTALGKLPPLAFTETGLKARIKNVLNYKKPVLWLSSLLLTVILMTGVTLLTNPQSDKTSLADKNTEQPQAAQAVREEKNTAGSMASEKETARNQSALKNPTGADSQSPAGESYQIKRYVRNMNFVMTTDIESRDTMKLIDQLILNMYLSSTYQEGINVKALEKHWEITILYGKYSTPSEFYLYQSDGIPYLQSVKGNFCFKISLKDYNTLLTLLYPDTDAANAVEKNLSTIMNSPAESSNPSDYLKKHPKECENIRKYGEKALYYMLTCFYKGEGDTLKGYLMMYLCEDILGDRSNEKDINTTPGEWYRYLYIQPQTALPDFTYQGDNKILKLVYETETKMHPNQKPGFTIVSPHLFGYYEEGDALKVFATTLFHYYILNGEKLMDMGGGVTPSAMTFRKEKDGSYTLTEYEQAADGSYFKSSIEAYCVLPLSGKKIPGLAKEIMDHYSNYSDLISLSKENLKAYQKEFGLENVTIKPYIITE